LKQIKEKPERIKGLKEHVKAVPKEVLRGGVNAGAEKMKAQLRDVRQQEQPEDYASEKVETAVEGIPSAAVFAAARLWGKKKAVEKRSQEASVKTKDSYIQQQTPTTSTIQPQESASAEQQQSQSWPQQSQESQTFTQGKRLFLKERSQQIVTQRTARQPGTLSQPARNDEIPTILSNGPQHDITGQSPIPHSVEYKAGMPVRRNVREIANGRRPAASPSKVDVKTIQRAEMKAGKVVGRTPKQAVKTADIVDTPPKSVQAVRQAKNLAARTIRSAQKLTKEAVAAVAKAVSSALGGLLAAGGGIVVLIILVVVLFGGVLLFFGEGPDSTAYTPVSEEVQAYEPLIRLYAEKHGIPEYVELIKAVMMTESGGKGKDPMQSAESGYNTRYPRKPNGITDPEYSIDVGVQSLAAVLKAAKVESPLDLEHIKLALQAYNFGPGYITWAVNKYGGYTEANAIEFSEMMAKRLGWKMYGSTKYVSVVLQYYPFGYAPTEGGTGGYIWPLPGYTRISSPFGYRNCPYHGRELHGGVDLPAPLGTNILAVKSGTVVVSTYGSSYGNHVAISHPDGSRTMYCHMSARLVSVGDTVAQGQVIGRVGSTGNSTGNHLHFEVWTSSSSSSRVNPMDYY